MTLTVTPGASDADSFVSVADCDAYCEARGLSDWTGAADSPADVKEAALRRATAFLSQAFGWKGARTNGREQALAWPRTGVEDAEGETVSDDEIPVEIVQATCEVAAREVVTPGFTSPDVTLTERIKSERIGPMSVEYQTAPLMAEAARPVMTRVRDLVAGLVSGSANPLVGETVRR